MCACAPHACLHLHCVLDVQCSSAVSVSNSTSTHANTPLPATEVDVHDLNGTLVQSFEDQVLCRYVKRELRSLSNEDRIGVRVRTCCMHVWLSSSTSCSTCDESHKHNIRARTYAAFLDAAEILWKVDGDEGREKYGNKFTSIKEVNMALCDKCHGINLEPPLPHLNSPPHPHKLMHFTHSLYCSMPSPLPATSIVIISTRALAS